MVDVRTTERDKKAMADDQIRQDEWNKSGVAKRNADANYPDSVGKPVADAVPAPKEKITYDSVSNINKELYDAEYKLDYPFNDLEVGHGFFVPNRPAETTIKNLERMHTAVVAANDFYSEAEVDASGDEIWETVFVKSRQRNADGSFKLTGDGKFIESADQINRPRLIYFRHYMAYAIIKDYEISEGNKAKEDGVLVIRVN